MNKAVFLDRDGTINEDVGDFCSPEKLIFVPRVIEALRVLQEILSLTSQELVKICSAKRNSCSLTNILKRFLKMKALP